MNIGYKILLKGRLRCVWPAYPSLTVCVTSDTQYLFHLLSISIPKTHPPCYRKSTYLQSIF